MGNTGFYVKVLVECPILVIHTVTFCAMATGLVGAVFFVLFGAAYTALHCLLP